MVDFRHQEVFSALSSTAVAARLVHISGLVLKNVQLLVVCMVFVLTVLDPGADCRTTNPSSSAILQFPVIYFNDLTGQTDY